MAAEVASAHMGMNGIKSTPAQLYYLWPAQKQEFKQFSHFCWIDLAHVVMLVEQGTVDRDVGQKLLPSLQDIREQGYQRLPIDPFKESLLFQVEGALSQKHGDRVAGALHTARSRIDQRATAGRMYHRDLLLQAMDRIQQFQACLVNAAKKHSGRLVPYYTHMQQAQPGNFGHYLLAFAAKLQEDFERCQEAYRRVNRNPLGTVGRSGTGLRIERQRTTQLLGFDSPIHNSLLGRDADYAADIVAALSFVMYHLNDFATDMHVWATSEFGYIQLPEAYCATSSIFPQKRNPVTLEVIKCAAGPATSWLASTLSTFRGEGTGDQKVHGAPAHLQSSIDTTSDMLELACLVVDAIEFNDDRIKQVFANTWSTTSNLSDTLMQSHGLSIREAYSVVKRVVRHSIDNGITRSQVTPELVRQASLDVLDNTEIEMSVEELHLALDPEGFVKTRTSSGSVGPAEVQNLILAAEEMLSENKEWSRERREQLSTAESQLEEAVAQILKGI